MSIILELTPEEETRLHAQAARRGQSADVLARALFRRGLDLEDVPDPQQRTDGSAMFGQTLADTLQEFIGIVDSRMTEPLDANQVSGKSAVFTDILAEKARRQGLTL